jgi:hypothetical protein
MAYNTNLKTFSEIITDNKDNIEGIISDLVERYYLHSLSFNKYSGVSRNGRKVDIYIANNVFETMDGFPLEYAHIIEYNKSKNRKVLIADFANLKYASFTLKENSRHYKRIEEIIPKSIVSKKLFKVIDGWNYHIIRNG